LQEWPEREGDVFEENGAIGGGTPERGKLERGGGRLNELDISVIRPWRLKK